MRPVRFTPLLRKGLLLVALAVYTLAFAEIFVRVVKPQPLVPRYITGTPWGVRGNIPQARYRHWTEEVEVEYRINKEGMRDDREFAFAKPAGMCRIALFGDSFFVGYELDLRDTFATQIERRLRAEGYRVEVLNFAVSGFGTAEMLRTYEAYGRKFDPDVVIFQWHASDFDDNVRSGLYRLENGELKPGRKEYLPAVRLQDRLMRSALYRLVADHSHLYAILRQKVSESVKHLLVTLRKRKVGDEPAGDGEDGAAGQYVAGTTSEAGVLRTNVARPAALASGSAPSEADTTGVTLSVPGGTQSGAPQTGSSYPHSAGSGAGSGNPTVPGANQDRAGDDQGPDPSDYSWSPRVVALSAALLERVRATMEAEGRDFFVVDIPRRVTRTEFFSSIDALPEETRSRLTIVSPQEIFTRSARPDLKIYYEKGHGHLTPIGVQMLVAETLPVLRTSPRLARCSGPIPRIPLEARTASAAPDRR